MFFNSRYFTGRYWEGDTFQMDAPSVAAMGTIYTELVILSGYLQTQAHQFRQMIATQGYGEVARIFVRTALRSRPRFTDSTRDRWQTRVNRKWSDRVTTFEDRG